MQPRDTSATVTSRGNTSEVCAEVRRGRRPQKWQSDDASARRREEEEVNSGSDARYGAQPPSPATGAGSAARAAACAAPRRSPPLQCSVIPSSDIRRDIDARSSAGAAPSRTRHEAPRPARCRAGAARSLPAAPYGSKPTGALQRQRKATVSQQESAKTFMPHAGAQRGS